MISPSPNQIISILDKDFRFLPIPTIPNIVYCETGRKARIYKLQGSDHKNYALKVFLPKFRKFDIFVVCNLLSRYKWLPSLEILDRSVITHENNHDLVTRFPDLEYAILMPWIESNPWINIFMEKVSISDNEAVLIAKRLGQALVDLEIRGLAHTDLSGSNLLINLVDAKISLVGLETMFGEEFPKPTYIPSGTPGYAHKSAAINGQWCSEGDRFSAAILFSEIFIASDKKNKESAYGESFFSQKEIGEISKRYEVGLRVLSKFGSSISYLFKQAWMSNTLSDCPDITSWKSAIDQL